MRSLKDLPDLAGFEFIGIDREGREYYCKVCQFLSSGAFYIGGVTAFVNITHWRHLDRPAAAARS